MPTSSVTSTELTERARAVALVADQHAEFGDAEGRLADPVVEALHREGLFGMWIPKSVPGGAELDPVSSLQVIENLTYGDPSAGWVLMAAALAVGTGAAFLSDAAVGELFGKSRLPVIAGQGTRPGTAVPNGDGFLLNGSWSFASGIKHGTHIHTLGVIEGTGEARIFVLPVEKATLIDNWDVMGLRATGSIDYRIDQVFVPEGYTHPALIETPKRGGALYGIGVIGFAIICHSAWACGIGRRVLDQLTTHVRGKVGRTGTLATSEAFLQQYAKAEGTYRAARALVYEAWGDVLGALERGDRLSTRQHTLIRLALAHANLVGARSGDVRLRRGRHDGLACRHAAAVVSRHARWHSARDLVAAGVPGDRPRPRGSRAWLRVEISRFGGYVGVTARRSAFGGARAAADA